MRINTSAGEMVVFNGGIVGGNLAHIQSLCDRERVIRKGEDMVPVVVADGVRCPTEGYTKRDFGIYTVSEAAGIRQAWRDGKSEGRGQK